MTRRFTVATSLAMVTALLGSVLAATPGLAADGDLSWGIQPSTPGGPDGRADLSYQVAPGTVITDWVALTNYSSVPVTFRVYPADATTDYDTASFTLINADEVSTDTGSWTSIDGKGSVCDAGDDACIASIGSQVALDPGARADIPFTITVPQDATPGDHAAGIVASYVNDATSEGTGVSIEQRVGTRIYLRVDGALTPAITVTGTVAGYDSGFNPISGTSTVEFDLRNTGNTRLSAQPSATFTGPFGITLGVVQLLPVENIVPGGVAHVTAELPGVPPLFLLFADVTITPAAAEGIAAGDPLPAATTVSVVAWAVPWMLMLVFTLIVGVIVLVVWLRRRSRQRLAQDIAAYADEVRAEVLRDVPGLSTSSKPGTTRSKVERGGAR